MLSADMNAQERVWDDSESEAFKRGDQQLLEQLLRRVKEKRNSVHEEYMQTFEDRRKSKEAWAKEHREEYETPVASASYSSAPN